MVIPHKMFCYMYLILFLMLLIVVIMLRLCFWIWRKPLTVSTMVFCINYLINGSTLSWLTSYLSQRTQQVIFQGSLSSSGCVKVGVPQGSILGSLQFSIYVNDLPNAISSSDVSMFADDTKIHFSYGNLSTVEQTLQAYLQNVSGWLVTNRLKLNIVKSLCMLIGSYQRISGKCLDLFLNNSALKQVLCKKYLGVFFDHHLTWESHINYVF